jgi:radical SAM superfamily enzyme YgiQ (UPF0313 family)
MKILLLSANMAVEPYAVFPLGLGVVAHALRQAGHAVEMHDSMASGNNPEQLRWKIKEFKPELIGLSIRNIDNVNSLNPVFYLDDAAALVAELRKCTSAPIFAGGAGFSLIPEAALEYVGADFGIAGAGETAAPRLAAMLENGEVPPKIISGEIAPEGFGRCDYDRKITDFYLAETGILPIQTKRGCPHNCVYCSYPRLEGCRVIPRPADEVIEEIKMLNREFSPSLIYFTDSVFNDTDGNYLELLEKMASCGISTPWCSFFTPHDFDRETLQLMRRSGLKTVELGADGTTDATLAGLGKAFDFDTVTRACSAFRDTGIQASCSYIAGGPGESRETIRQGIANIRQLDFVSAFVFMGIRILPGTRLAEIAVEQGLISPDNNLLHPEFYFSPEISCDELFEELCSGLATAKHAVFPPQSSNRELQLFQRLRAAQRKEPRRNG